MTPTQDHTHTTPPLPAYGAAKKALGKAECPAGHGLLAAAALENSLYCTGCDDLIHKSEWVIPS